ncbi:MAG: DNA repair protein RecN [Thermodesulfobacteriota bacterium]|nr:DNA repair protein RecN [Thermodesulfobacteriota bacterium]
MLRELSIRNFAIIDDLSISFERGLTMLTGETGAGKSIIINAVNLILGSRASPELIRTSEETAELEALFEVPSESAAARTARQRGVDVSAGLLVRRTIQRNGRNKIYINGRLATSQILSSINLHLASVAGQHAHQNLLNPDYHLLVLDQSAGLVALRGEVGGCYHDVLPLIKRLATLRRKLAGQSEYRELLEFQHKEIEQADIKPWEDQEVEQELQRLKHAERLYETVGMCVDRLYGGEGALIETLIATGKELEVLSKIDHALLSLKERMDTVSYELEDVAQELQNYLQGIVFDSERLEATESRLDTLQRLKRKYGGSLDSVMKQGREIKEELRRVSSLPEEIVETEARLGGLYDRLTGLCQKLSEKRKEAATHFAGKVQKEMVGLGMPKARFEVRFKGVPFDENQDPHLVLGASGIEATGMDRIEFLMAPNVGEDLRPLAQIASGGELSRMILALKAILATKESVETLIFDEVDAGIGGSVAEMVGKKLASLAEFHQVLCITHLPQIAQFGTHHFKIQKGVHGGRTRTTMTLLEGEARVKEMARMLAGVEITAKAMAHAREMIKGRAS